VRIYPFKRGRGLMRAWTRVRSSSSSSVNIIIIIIALDPPAPVAVDVCVVVVRVLGLVVHGPERPQLLLQALQQLQGDRRGGGVGEREREGESSGVYLYNQALIPGFPVYSLKGSITSKPLQGTHTRVPRVATRRGSRCPRGP
jgi:hypothetical protein